MASLLPSICSLGTAALLCASVNLGGGGVFADGIAPLQAKAAIAGPAPSDLPEVSSSDRKVRIHKAPDGLFYVSAKVNGTPVRFLVDTGANLVVLTAEDARRVGTTPGAQRGHGDIETAGGTSRMDRVTLERVSVAGRDLTGVDAAVMHGGLTVSLMGQNMLSKLGPIILTANDMAIPDNLPETNSSD